MHIQARVLTVLVMSTGLAGAAFAADQTTASPPKVSAAQSAADHDAGKLSTDGAAAFRNMHMARLAIFNANPAEAKALIVKAQSELKKAKTDEAVFTKAESDLKQPPAAPGTAAAPTTTANADKATPIAWLPVDGQLALSDDFVATPEKAAAVTEANKSLAKGDRKEALEKLKLADVNVSFTMAVVPLTATTNDVDKAVTLIDDGKFYEANAVLKQAEDGVRFDMVDLNENPKAQPAQQAQHPAPEANTTSSTAKTTK